MEPIGYDARSLHTVKLYWQFNAVCLCVWVAQHIGFGACLCFVSEYTGLHQTDAQLHARKTTCSNCMKASDDFPQCWWRTRLSYDTTDSGQRKNKRPSWKEANANKPFRNGNGYFQFSVIVVYCFPLSAHVSQTQSRHNINRFVTHRYVTKWRYRRSIPLPLCVYYTVYSCEKRMMDEIGYSYYVYHITSLGWCSCRSASS